MTIRRNKGKSGRTFRVNPIVEDTLGTPPLSEPPPTKKEISTADKEVVNFIGTMFDSTRNAFDIPVDGPQPIIQSSPPPEKEGKPDKGNTVRIDDVVATFDEKTFTKGFREGREKFRAELIKLVEENLYLLTAIQDVSDILKHKISPGSSLDTSSMSNAVARNIELKFLGNVMQALQLDESVREQVIAAHIQKVWGPAKAPVSTVTTGGTEVHVDAANGKSSSRRSTGSAGNSDSGGKKSLKPADRPPLGQVSMGGKTRTPGPFGIL